MDQARIRNFCIIAHIDHGKSTLADRLMELTGTVEKRNMKAQLLDRMDLEREKGITIKLAPVRMTYKTSLESRVESREVKNQIAGTQDSREYELNLIDTPGHVDFSYEVSRSLQACEGALLVVDASQGIQAQTLANVYLAMEQDLAIIPVLNKIDLPAADVERVSREVISLLGCKQEDILLISAKTGLGVEAVLERIVADIPPPTASRGLSSRSERGEGDRGENAIPGEESVSTGHTLRETRALIFDSYYDDYRGVILYVRLFEGSIPKNGQIRMLATGAHGLALEVGALKPDMVPTAQLGEGEIGYIVTNLKSTREARVGDTVTLASAPAAAPLPGYKNVQPFVYAGFFPESNEYYQELKDAVEKLSLSDSALQFAPENSPVLGFGVRIGFLGLLHMDIIRERLEREYNLDLVVTNPSTDYQVTLITGEELDIKSASDLPDPTKIAEIREPWIKGEIVVPQTYVGPVIQLISGKRGLQKNLSYMEDRALVSFEAPLANLLTDFYDQLKSITSGYGSFNYELDDYRAEDLVKVDFYVAGQIVSSLSVMAHRSESQRLGREIVEKLKEVIPRQNFQVALQAGINGRFIAREDISAYRKDVTTGLYGGDVSRKKKVLAKQAKGKKRMKRFGKVDIPAEAFTVMLKRD